MINKLEQTSVSPSESNTNKRVVIPKEEKDLHFHFGGKPEELSDRYGCALSTAEKAEMDWKKRIDHPDVQHTLDKNGQVRRWLPKVIKNMKDGIVYEACSGGFGNLTKQFKALCETVYNFGYDARDPEYWDCAAVFKRWVKTVQKSLKIHVLDLDGYGPMAHFFESGVLDRLAPNSLIFYTFPHPCAYFMNNDILADNKRVFGFERLTPEHVYAGFIRMLERHGFEIAESECMKLGGIFRMVLLCKPLTAAVKRRPVFGNMNDQEIRAMAKEMKKNSVLSIMKGFQDNIPREARIAKAIEIIRSGQADMAGIDLIINRHGTLNEVDFNLVDQDSKTKAALARLSSIYGTDNVGKILRQPNKSVDGEDGRYTVGAAVKR